MNLKSIMSKILFKRHRTYTWPVLSQICLENALLCSGVQSIVPGTASPKSIEEQL